MTAISWSSRNETKISPKIAPAIVVFWTDSEGDLMARSGLLG
jgi:hypothetical protein